MLAEARLCAKAMEEACGSVPKVEDHVANEIVDCLNRRQDQRAADAAANRERGDCEEHTDVEDSKAQLPHRRGANGIGSVAGVGVRIGHDAGEKDANHDERNESAHSSGPPNESRLSCGALKKDSFLSL